jgi:hypothetical protein
VKEGERLLRLPLEVRKQLLLVLDSRFDVRADAIRQLYERDLDLAGVLMDLEAEPVLRLEVLALPRRSIEGREPNP